MLDGVIQDIRYGLRLIRKHPLLSAAIMATLALGIGLDAGAFTLIDGMLFRPRVSEQPSTFAQLDPESSGPGFSARGGLPMVSLTDYTGYRDRATSLTALAAWTPAHTTLTGGPAASTPQDIVSLLVTCNFFSVYPAVPLAGRIFRQEECAEPGESPVVLIGEDLWRGRFESDPGIAGTIVDLNGRPFTIVGVLPSAYDGRLRGSLWIPYTMQAAFFAGRELFREPSAPWLVMVGRLRPGSSRGSAAAELQVIAQQLDQLQPGRRTTMRLTNGSMFEMMRSPALALSIVPLVMGALSLVLLMACANVTILLLSRAAARQHEIAVRVSLGATRGRIIQMLVTESVLLAVVAGPASLWIALEVPVAWKSRIAHLPFYPFQFDAPAFGYMAAVTLAAGCLAALAPALEALKRGTAATLQGQDAFGGKRWRTADLLVVAQVAMSLVLLVGAGLLLRADRAIRSANPGFDAAHVLLATPKVAMPPYTQASAAAFYQRLAGEVRALPGVRSVAFASAPPLGDSEAGADTITLRQAGGDRVVPVNAVSEQYFDALNISIARGRALRDEDAAERIPPAVVSESLARALWPATDPIGQFVDASTGRRLEVVGIARDIDAVVGDAARASMLYLARASDSHGDALLVRVNGDAAPVARAVREAIRSLDVNATADPRTLSAIRDDLADRFMRIVGVVVFLGAVAIGLAAIGLYGVAAFTAGRRMKEMGVRIALGATRRDIVTLVLRSGLRSILAGVGIGVAAAALVSRGLQRVLAWTPIDIRSPALFASAAAMLVLIALAAMFGPARRAASADPIHALRRD